MGGSVSEVKTLDFGFRQAARRNYTQAAGTELLFVHCYTAMLFCTDDEMIPTFSCCCSVFIHENKHRHKKYR